MADSSSKLIKALFSSSNSGENKTNFDASKINPRILKILGVNEFDIEDEQEYLSLLKEKMLLISMEKSKLPREDEEVIIEEFKRIKSKKFPKKKLTADSFKRGTAVEDFINKNVGVNLNIKSLGGSIKPQQLALPPAVDKMSGKSDIQEIIDSLASIIEQLTLFNSLSRDEQERDRRSTENRRRREREGELEKGFDGVMKAAEKVIAPVKSILDRIINFLVMTLIGRSLVLILRWFSDPENKKKVEAIGRFLGDHWPKLLALFIAFGTGLGGFVRGLIGVVIKGTGALIKGAFWLAKKAGIKGAAGAFKFLGGPKGKLIGKGLELAAVVGGTLALSKGLEDFGGIGGGETSPPAGLSGEEETTPPAGLSGEEEITPRATFSGGGFANLKNLFGNIGGMFNGVVSGPKGTDKVPAMLTDGEFVMSRGAVQKYGVDTLEGMNAAGGGNNKPKVVEGTTYAAGGGLIGDKLKAPELRKEAESGLVKSKPSFGPGATPQMSSQEDMNKKTNQIGLEKRESEQKKLFGPGATPQMSSQEDMNKKTNQIRFEDRIKRIENQIQVNLALSQGKGINIKGATSGAQLGTGYSAKYQGRNSIVIKGGAKNFTSGIGDNEITLGGNRYYAQKRGDDVIYSRAKAGGSLMGGSGLKSIDKKKLPPTQIMMGGDGKPFVGFLAFEKGEPVYKRGATPGTGTTNPLEALGRWMNPNAYKENDKKMEERKKREAEVNSLEYYKGIGMRDSSIKQQMTATGQNYTRASNDLQYRQNTQAKIAPTKPTSKSSAVTPPQQNKVNVTYVESMKKRRAARTAGGTSSAAPQVPQFSSSSRTRSRKRTASTYGIG
jgi:hypothetical protein